MNDSKVQVENDDPKTLASNLYAQNIEITEKNKTLSILSKLYAISILTLEPKEIAVRISQTIQIDLSLELVGILIYDKTKDQFTPLAFASSERLNTIQSDYKKTFDTIKLSVADNAFLKRVIETKAMAYTEKLSDIWDSLISQPMLAEITSKGHVRFSTVYPLIIQEEVMGILVLSLNRLYLSLAQYERESLESLVNVVAVGLYKALLYEELKVANEHLKVLDQARAEFITIASHQLRTPPATIKWYLAAILGGDYGKFDDSVKEQLRKTASTNNSMIALIDDLLNASRIERGKMEFVFVPTNLTEITQITVDQLLPQAEMKKLNLVFVKPKVDVPIISADREKLRQVINNLIDNAIKYTMQGKIEVSITQTKKDLIFKVADSGKGIPPEQLDHIFKKYERGQTAARNSSGLGLGLYVAKVIVEQHKGKIWVESKGLGKGSSFIFSIPIKAELKNTEFDLAGSQKPAPTVVQK